MELKGGEIEVIKVDIILTCLHVNNVIKFLMQCSQLELPSTVPVLIG